MEIKSFHRIDILDNKKAPPEGEAGGRGEIRTLGALLHKAFLVPHHRPLGHSSNCDPAGNRTPLARMKT